VETIGLTGGIATGKSTVAAYLQQLQIPLVDADLLAREAVLPGSVGLRSLVERYGQELLEADGTLNRGKLAQLIFSSPQDRQQVEAIIHPFVRHRLAAERDRLSPHVLVMVMVVPLLFEAKMTDLVSRIWVVSCTANQQLNRLMHRNALTQAEAEARIHSQMPLAQKCALADVVLNNASSLEELHAQVDQALRNVHGSLA
jgi:dephospho-CoA kinase